MPHDGQSQRLDIIKRNIKPAVEHGTGLGRRHQVDGGTRATAPGNPVLDEIRGALFGGTRSAHQCGDILHEVIGNRDACHKILQRKDLFLAQRGHDLFRFATRYGVNNVHLFIETWVFDVDLEHKPVQLRFRQCVGPLLLQGVLGRKDEEREIQSIVIAVRRDHLLLHRLQQRCLRLGRGAVDLVCQQNIGEDRALGEDELSFAGFRIILKELCTRNVRRHQVGGELNAVKRKRKGFRDRADQQGLGKPRNSFQQTMTPRENRNDHLIYNIIHPHNLLAQLIHHLLTRRPKFLDSRNIVLRNNSPILFTHDICPFS